MIHPRQIARPLAVALVALTCFAAWPAVADEQSERVKALEKRLEESLRAQAENARLIQALAARVAELERAAKASGDASAKAPSAAASTATATDHGPAIAELQQSVAQISEGLSKRSSNGDNG